MDIQKRILIAGIALAAFAMTGCNNNKTSEADNTQTETIQSSEMEVDRLLAEADSLVGKEITVTGICTHTCKHGARKIFLMGSDDTQIIRIEAGELGAFSQDCVNNIVTVEGILIEQRIDEAYLQEWETKAKAQTAEKHGENREGGCDTEKNARGESGNSIEERIADFRKRIEAEQEKTGKNYLSFYYVEAKSYEIER